MNLITTLSPSPAMEHKHLARRRHCLLLLLVVIASALLVPSPVRADGGGMENDKEEEGEKPHPNPAERAIGVTTAAFNTRWDAVKTWAKLAWMHLLPPASQSESSPGEVVKDAAARSFKTSKEAVEEAARSAAEAAGNAVDRTKEKVKRTVSSPRDAEL